MMLISNVKKTKKKNVAIQTPCKRLLRQPIVLAFQPRKLSADRAASYERQPRTEQLRKNLLLLLAMGLLCLLTACSDGNGNLASPSNSISTSAAKTATTNNLPASNQNSSDASHPSPTGVYDPAKTFIFGLAQEPIGFNQIGFDPAQLTDRASLMVTRQLYEGLFEYKPDSMSVVYSSFVRNVQPSTDGLTYRIRLRKGIIFSDGTALDAAAVKFNFDRWSNEGSIYHKGEFETWRKFWGGFPGNLVSVQVLDSINLIITLKTPSASFFQVLAMPQFGIVAPSAFDTNGSFQQATGSGPYLLSQIIRDEPKRLVLKSNPNYIIERQDENRLPDLSQVVVQILRANQDGLKELKDGHLSATDKVRPEQTLQTDPAYQILLRPPLNITFLSMNQSKAPFDNPSVRRAFAYAINTTALTNPAFMGLSYPANGLLPPTALGYRAEQSAYPYDPTQARQLLAQAGYSSGLVVDLWRLPEPRPYYPDTQKVADAVVQDLARVGVTVHIQNSDWATFYQNRDDGNIAFFMNGWQGVNGDPDEFLQAIFNQTQRANGYYPLSLERLIEQARNSPATTTTTLDPARQNLYRQIFDQIYQDVPNIPLAFVKEPLAIRPNIAGYILNPSGIDSWANLKLK